MKEWGIPDWLDQAAYGDTSEWSRHRWFWEFLRRREDLRREFDRKKGLTYERKLSLWKMDSSVSPDGVTPPDKAGFTVSTMLIYPDRALPEPLPNPRIGDQPAHAIPRLYDRVLFQLNKNFIGVDERHYRIDFDLDMPIGPQIEEAKDTLREFQIHRHGKTLQKRRHPDKWLMYLRVLDAREAGSTWSEIAEILSATVANEQTARDIHKQASALCFNF